MHFGGYGLVGDTAGGIAHGAVDQVHGEVVVLQLQPIVGVGAGISHELHLCTVDRLQASHAHSGTC